ncbi:AAA domain protein [Toxoplasma gondii MAS]|uniref:AAA domain protein n=1 Tax=Toxoplasma gondii MAS TaxID=943118 RepID=A0A086QRY4_TOXGO|nr:AAA domain protein [Toxoplasma gondii MAS]
MPRGLLPVSTGVLPAPTSPGSHLSTQRSCRKKAAVSEQAVVASVSSPLSAASRSKKRREPPVLGVRSQDSEVEEEPLSQRKAPDSKKRRNSTARILSLSSGGTDCHTLNGGSEEAREGVPSFSLPPSLSETLIKRSDGVSQGRGEGRLAVGGPSSPSKSDSPESDTERAETPPPRRVTRQMMKEDLEAQQKAAGSRGATGEVKCERGRAEQGRGGRKSGCIEQRDTQREAEERRELHALKGSTSLERVREHRRRTGDALGEEEVEMTSPAKRPEDGQRRAPEEASQEGLDGVSDLDSEAEEDLKLQDLDGQIEKFEAALSLLRPTVGDYAGEREESVQAIGCHIDKLLARKRGGMIYLCGASGTGKTCTALHVLDQKLKEAKHRGKIHKELVTVSCAHREKDAQLFCEMLMRMLPSSSLPSERALYSDLKSALLKEGVGGLVTRFTNFTKRFEKLWLCLVDEVDFLTTTGKIRADVRDCPSRGSGGGAGGRGYGSTCGSASHKNALQQDILMALALAATHPQSKIVVVAISNSSELAQHFTGLPVPSLTFCPYTERQLTSLLLKRLEVLGGQQCFAAPAILVFARKAANTYGDFRMALSGFCRAIEDKLGSLHEERARALLAAASRSRSRASLCSTAAPPSRSMTGEAFPDSPLLPSDPDSTVASKSRKRGAQLPPADTGASPSKGKLDDAWTQLEAPGSPAALAQTKQKTSSALPMQHIALPSRKEEGEKEGCQQAPTPSFSALLNRSVLTGETPQHLQQTSPSTAASTSSLSPLTSSCHSPGRFSQTMEDARRKHLDFSWRSDEQDAGVEGGTCARTRRATQECMHATRKAARGGGDDGVATETARRSGSYTDANSPHVELGSPVSEACMEVARLSPLHAPAGESPLDADSQMEVDSLPCVACLSSAKGGEAQTMMGEEGEDKSSGAGSDPRADGLEVEQKDKKGRHRQSTRRRESVRGFPRVSSDVSSCRREDLQEPKLRRDSQVGSEAFLSASMSPSVRSFASVDPPLSASTTQPRSLGACPAATFFPSSPPSPLSLSSFSPSTTATPPLSPFFSATGRQVPRGSHSQGSGHRRRLGSQLSALKLLQAPQEPPGSVDPPQSRRPSSCSSGSSPSRSLGLREIQNLKSASSQGASLNHLLSASSRASHSPLSSREPSRSGDNRGVLRNASESGDTWRTGREGGAAEVKPGKTTHGGENGGRCGSRRSGEVGPNAAWEGRASVTQVIGVGEMNARAGAVFGNDQQNVVARIQGLPLMHQVYLLAACRSALKRVHEANAGGLSQPATGREERGTGRHSQENVSSQQREQLLGCGGSVDITFTDVEVQYRQLCQELQNGYLLSQHMATSCWRHALEAFEQMGLMRPKRPGVLGSGAASGLSGLSSPATGASLSSPLKGSMWGGSARGFGAFGPFGGGPRRSSGGLFVGMGGGGAGAGGAFKAKLTVEREQAWELQLSPALIEAAIKRLQPILMSSDLEEHFTRGLEA